MASVIEFIHVWRTGNEAFLSLDCKDGKSKLSFEVNLGRPDEHDVRENKKHKKNKKNKKKSATKVLKNNAQLLLIKQLEPLSLLL